MIQDFRYALGMLGKSPGFTMVVILTLALGIAANSTIFSWISATLLNPIPGVTDTADLATIMRGQRSDHPTPPFSFPDFRDLPEHTQSLAGMLAYHDDFVSLTGTRKPERVYGALTSANYFDVLGVPLIAGRGFLQSEEQQGGAAIAVISYRIWQSHFSGEWSVIGQSIELNRHPYTREIGIRMALGAAKGQIYRLVLGQGLRLTLAGLLVGVTLSLALTRFLKSKLYGVSSTDVLTYMSVAMVLTVVALVACHIPARRATKIEPTTALRGE